MNKRLVRVAERRALLLAKVAGQRETLARNVEVWGRPLSMVDRGLAAMRFVANHPAWIVGSVLAPTALQPGRMGSWLRRGAAVFQLVSRLRSGRSRGLARP